MSDKMFISRRKFLKTTGITAGLAAVGGSLIAFETAEAKGNDAHDAHTAASKNSGIPRARMFFTNVLDFNILSAAAERIFPKDELGPGAVDLGVPYFIDHQLAGAYGYNAREYMVGPHFEGAPTQGYQTPLLRKDLFLQGIAAINKQAKTQYKMDFPDLSPAQQDDILKMCEKGDIRTEGFKSSFFFSVFKGAVIAGVYADPMYGGNADMSGWKMKQYPGARMAYTDIIDSDKFEKIEPVSLADMM
ncbi:MAG: gluconate 2-dehydrogenase subunit 3 family protein [Deferribacterales bacterium]